MRSKLGFPLNNGINVEDDIAIYQNITLFFKVVGIYSMSIK